MAEQSKDEGFPERAVDTRRRAGYATPMRFAFSRPLSKCSKCISLLALCVSVTGMLVGGCARPLVGPNPPIDRAVFPVGLAVHPSGQFLAVASSNYDLRYNRGAFLLADLNIVDDALQNAAGSDTVVTNAYVAGALIPSFANRPIFVSDGSRALIATRDGNRVVEIPINTDGARPTIDCSVTEEDGTVVCGEAPFVLNMTTNDPFELVLTSETATSWRGLVSSLSDSTVFAFRIRNDREDATRAQILSASSVDFGENTLSVRGLALRTEGPDVAFATREIAQEGITRVKSDLVWWVFEDGRDARILERSVSDDVGSLNARAITFTPDQSGLLMLLRSPPALARYDVTGTGANTQVRFSGAVGTCDDPIRLTMASFSDGAGVEHERALLTCFSDDSVVAYDPLTLAELDSVRFFGRGPYDVVTDGQRAYVSYFLDDSVGVIDLVDADGRAKLTPRGRIGTQRPAPENGR